MTATLLRLQRLGRWLRTCATDSGEARLAGTIAARNCTAALFERDRPEAGRLSHPRQFVGRGEPNVLLRFI